MSERWAAQEHRGLVNRHIRECIDTKVTIRA